MQNFSSESSITLTVTICGTRRQPEHQHHKHISSSTKYNVILKCLLFLLLLRSISVKTYSFNTKHIKNSYRILYDTVYIDFFLHLYLTRLHHSNFTIVTKSVQNHPSQYRHTQTASKSVSHYLSTSSTKYTVLCSDQC